MKIYDISQELRSCKVYPGDTAPAFRQVRTLGRDGYNLTDITLCVHNGTHIDAPRHFIAGGKAVDELELPVFYGDCTLAEFSGVIGGSDIAPLLETCSRRLLIKGDCAISGDAAVLIANSPIKLLGVESQSIDSTDSAGSANGTNVPLRIHPILLGKGIILLEGLNLSAVAPGEYTLAAFPINIRGADGSPVRAVLIEY